MLALGAPADAAWTREKGSGFTAQTFRTYRSTEFVDDEGRRFAQPPFEKYEWNGYMEYGWRDGTTVGANLFAHYLATDALRYAPLSPTPESYTQDNYGLADSEFFIRQRLWQTRWKNTDIHIAVQPLLKLPSLYADGGSPRSGTDDFDAELRLQTAASSTIFGYDHFTMVDFAYRKRFGEWGDQLKSDLTYGLHLGARLLVLSQLHITYRPDGAGVLAANSTTVSDYDLMKAQISAVWKLTDVTRLQFGAYEDLAVRNTGQGRGLLFSIWREF